MKRKLPTQTGSVEKTKKYHSDKLSTLLDWFRQNGISYTNITFTYSNEEGFSAFATNNIDAEQIISNIPKSAILSPKTSSLKEILEAEDLVGGIALIICLMHEMPSKNSMWEGYIQSLPHQVDLPTFWDKSDFSNLQGTDFDSETIIKEEIELMREDYDTIVLPLVNEHKIFNKKEMTFELFQRAASLVASRAFAVDNYHDLAMVPLCDLFNHKSGGENVHMVCQAEVCEQCGAEGKCSHVKSGQIAKSPSMITMTTSSPIQANEQVFNVYDDHSNIELLLKYGYTHLDNPFDRVNVSAKEVQRALESVGLFKQERFQFWQKKKKHFMEEEDKSYWLGYNETYDPLLMYLLFIIFAKEESFLQWKKSIETFAEYVETAEATRKMKMILTVIAIERMKRYETSLEEDVNALESDISSRARFCLILSICEKRILKKFIDAEL